MNAAIPGYLPDLGVEFCNRQPGCTCDSAGFSMSAADELHSGFSIPGVELKFDDSNWIRYRVDRTEEG